MANPKKNSVCGKDLATRVSKLVGLSRLECRLLITKLGEVLSDAVAAGEWVKFPNFGVLHADAKLVPVRQLNGKMVKRVTPVHVKSGFRLRKRLRTAASMKQV